MRRIFADFLANLFDYDDDIHDGRRIKSLILILVTMDLWKKREARYIIV